MEIKPTPITKIYIDDIPDQSYVERFRQLGVEQYCIIYQNNVDPTATTGKINVDAVIQSIEDNKPIGGGCSFKDAKKVVLDFEHPYMWPLMVGPEYIKTDSEGNTTTYESLKNELINLINTLKEKYPDKEWGFYSMPSIPAWCPLEGDPIQQSVPSGTRTAYLNKLPELQIRNLQKHLTFSFRPLTEVSDFVTTSLYQLDKQDGDSIGLDELDIKRSMIGSKVTANLAGEKESFAWVAPVFFNFANATGANAAYKVFDIIPYKETEQDVINPAIANGIDGFFVWLATNYRITQITSPLSRGGYAGLRDWFNKNFLANTGAPASDDAYWTAPHMKKAIETILTDWLYRFCESIINTMKNGEVR